MYFSSLNQTKASPPQGCPERTGKTLFFACSRHQRRYFGRLANATAGFDWLWYKQPSFYLPRLLSRRRVEPFIIQERIKTENGRGRPFNQVWRVGFNCLQWLRACWLYGKYRRWIDARRPTHSVVWNGLKFRQQIWELACQDTNVTVYYMENGLVPGHTTLDRVGVNYGNSVPRDPDFFRKRWVNGPRHQDAMSMQPSQSAEVNRSTILVPLQVNSDSQVVCYSPWIRSMRDLVELLIEIRGDVEQAGLRLVVKPHPKCSTPQDDLYEALRQNGIVVDERSKVSDWLPEVAGVITLNSTVGIEALLQNVPVIVLGQAFYNIEGLTLSADSKAELVRQVQNLKGCFPDPVLRSGFLGYLYDDYQIPGDWREATDAHVSAVIERIQQFQCGDINDQKC